MAAQHPNATHAHIDKALNDKDSIVREGAITNPNATAKHINKALKDEDPNVRRAASMQHSNAT